MVLLNSILPICMMILAGWFCRAIKLVDASLADPLTKFSFFPVAPALIFLALAKTDFSKLFDYGFLISYLITMIVIFFITLLISLLVFRKSLNNSCIEGMFCTSGNTVMIGFPVAFVLLGHEASIALSISLILITMICLPFLLFFFEHSKQSETNAMKLIGKTLLNNFKNPVIIALIAGILFSCFQVPLPTFVQSFLGYFASALIATALFSVGLSIEKITLKELISILYVSFLSLLVRPLIAWGIGILFQLTPVNLLALVIFNAIPTPKTFFVFAAKYRVFQKEAASIVSLSTICSVITIPVVVFVLEHFYPGSFLGHF